MAITLWKLRYLYCALWIGAEMEVQRQQIAMDALKQCGIDRLMPGEKASDVVSRLDSLAMREFRGELLRRGVKLPA